MPVVSSTYWNEVHGYTAPVRSCLLLKVEYAYRSSAAESALIIILEISVLGEGFLSMVLLRTNSPTRAIFINHTKQSPAKVRFY